MGGEWLPDVLRRMLEVVREAGLKSCLYTGLEREELSAGLLPYLTFLKTGHWRPELGGLDSPTTNQRFIRIHTDENLMHLFRGETI